MRQMLSLSGEQMAKWLLSVSGMMVLLSSSASLAQDIQPTDDPVLRCQRQTEVHHSWQGMVEWDETAVLNFVNEYENLRMITVKGEHPDGVVWGDCSINMETGTMVVYDFASGPYNILVPEEDPNEETTTEPSGSDASADNTSTS